MRQFLVLCFSLLLLNLKAQDNSKDSLFFAGNVYNENVKTVQLYKSGWNLSYPLITLGSSDRLLLSWDIIGDQSESYYYTIIHCDKDWNRSDIFPNDYIDGYEENPVEQYSSSFNTTVGYIHYKVEFPNDRINLRISGNYLIEVYPQGSPDKPLLTRRFQIVEEKVLISSNIHRPQMTKDNNSGQQVDFTVKLGSTAVSDPYRDIYAFVLQNGRWNNSRKNLKPEFYGNGELKYNSLSDKNIFKGGNEYRYFDIKSIRYQTEYIKNIEFKSPFYNVILQPSEDREFKPYFYWKDFNGRYYIAVQEGQNHDIDADYVYVYFTMPGFQQLQGGDLYISGSLTDWKYNRDNRMTYNPGKKQYEGTLFLKQGWYNYEYLFLKNGQPDAPVSVFEGNHYETENDYLILIYYRNPRERYDRLIGSSVANTLNKISD